MLVISGFIAVVVVGVVGYGWQQWEYNRLYNELERKRMLRRINVVTFSRVEKVAAREWM